MSGLNDPLWFYEQLRGELQREFALRLFATMLKRRKWQSTDMYFLGLVAFIVDEKTRGFGAQPRAIFFIDFVEDASPLDAFEGF